MPDTKPDPAPSEDAKKPDADTEGAMIDAQKDAAEKREDEGGYQ